MTASTTPCGPPITSFLTRRPSSHARRSGWSGYDLGTETGLKAGSLYPILVRLADQGLLEATWEGPLPQGRPPRHLYRLTPDGLELAAAPVLLPPGRGSARAALPLFYLVGVMLAAGALARRAPTRPGRAVIAGLSAGLALGGFFLATLAACGAPVDLGALIAPCLAGAVFAPIGAALAREVGRARRRSRGRP